MKTIQFVLSFIVAVFLCQNVSAKTSTKASSKKQVSKTTSKSVAKSSSKSKSKKESKKAPAPVKSSEPTKIVKSDELDFDTPAPKSSKASKEKILAYDACAVDSSGSSSGQGSVLDIAYDYSYRCKQGKKTDFKFRFKFDTEITKKLSDQSVDLGEYIVKSVADAKALVYKLVFLKKKTFGDEVEFYIQVPNRTSSVSKLVFCDNKPGLRSFEEECNRRQLRIDSEDLFIKAETAKTAESARRPSSKKDESQDLHHLFKIVQEIRNNGAPI